MVCVGRADCVCGRRESSAWTGAAKDVTGLAGRDFEIVGKGPNGFIGVWGTAEVDATGVRWSVTVDPLISPKGWNGLDCVEACRIRGGEFKSEGSIGGGSDAEA